MRIISGIARGTNLVTLEGLDTRPTLDRIKEPLFSIIQLHIEQANVLDLFAGSGALGLEALSRGADSAVFADFSYKAIDVINQNVEKAKFKEKSIVLKQNYRQALKRLKAEKQKFDIIFLDPPYKGNILLDSLKQIIESDLLSDKGIIVAETDVEKNIEEISNLNINIKDIRKYGRVLLIFLERKG